MRKIVIALATAMLLTSIAKHVEAQSFVKKTAVEILFTITTEHKFDAYSLIQGEHINRKEHKSVIAPILENLQQMMPQCNPILDTYLEVHGNAASKNYKLIRKSLITCKK